jgi:radical SAM superfamily enzyme YgiQ (UPF0313 family)
VTSGIIMGLDLETDESEARLIEFIDRSQIPIFTISVLQALPKTPLWERLAREGRLISDADQDSNVKFLRPRGAGFARSLMPTHRSACSPASVIRLMRPMRTGCACLQKAS